MLKITKVTKIRFDEKEGINYPKEKYILFVDEKNVEYISCKDAEYDDTNPDYKHAIIKIKDTNIELEFEKIEYINDMNKVCDDINVKYANNDNTVL